MYEELVKELLELSHEFYLDDNDEYTEAKLKEAADAIEEMEGWNNTLSDSVAMLTKQIAELSKPRWISVEERLPEELKFVLAAEDGTVFMAHCEHYYGEEEIYVEWHDTMYHPVSPTHWMSLPEPPKEET